MYASRSCRGWIREGRPRQPLFFYKIKKSAESPEGGPGRQDFQVSCAWELLPRHFHAADHLIKTEAVKRSEKGWRVIAKEYEPPSPVAVVILNWLPVASDEKVNLRASHNNPPAAHLGVEVNGFSRGTGSNNHKSWLSIEQTPLNTVAASLGREYVRYHCYTLPASTNSFLN